MVKRPVGIPILLFFRRRSSFGSLASPAHDRVKSMPAIPRNRCPTSREIHAHDQLKSVPTITRNAQHVGRLCCPARSGAGVQVMSGPGKRNAGSGRRLDRSVTPGLVYEFTVSKSGRDLLPSRDGMGRDTSRVPKWAQLCTLGRGLIVALHIDIGPTHRPLFPGPHKTNVDLGSGPLLRRS
jgi:hypothetical protein